MIFFFFLADLKFVAPINFSFWPKKISGLAMLLAKSTGDLTILDASFLVFLETEWNRLVAFVFCQNFSRQKFPIIIDVCSQRGFYVGVVETLGAVL